MTRRQSAFRPIDCSGWGWEMGRGQTEGGLGRTDAGAGGIGSENARGWRVWKDAGRMWRFQIEMGKIMESLARSVEDVLQGF